LSVTFDEEDVKGEVEDGVVSKKDGSGMLLKDLSLNTMSKPFKSRLEVLASKKVANEFEGLLSEGDLDFKLFAKYQLELLAEIPKGTLSSQQGFFSKLQRAEYAILILKDKDGEEGTKQLLSNWVFGWYEEPETNCKANAPKKLAGSFPILKISQVYPAKKSKDDLIIVYLSKKSKGPRNQDNSAAYCD